MRPKIEVREGEHGKWYWRLKGSNGEILAHSEVYESHRNALEGALAAVRAAGVARIETIATKV